MNRLGISYGHGLTNIKPATDSGVLSRRYFTKRAELTGGGGIRGSLSPRELLISWQTSLAYSYSDDSCLLSIDQVGLVGIIQQAILSDDYSGGCYDDTSVFRRMNQSFSFLPNFHLA